MLDSLAMQAFIVSAVCGGIAWGIYRAFGWIGIVALCVIVYIGEHWYYLSTGRRLR